MYGDSVLRRGFRGFQTFPFRGFQYFFSSYVTRRSRYKGTMDLYRLYRVAKDGTTTIYNSYRRAIGVVSLRIASRTGYFIVRSRSLGEGVLSLRPLRFLGVRLRYAISTSTNNQFSNYVVHSSNYQGPMTRNSVSTKRRGLLSFVVLR